MLLAFQINVKYALHKVKLTLHPEGVLPIKNNIKVLRVQHSMTQDQLAEKLFVSRQTIISLEKEKYNPSIILAFKLAEIFNCKIEDILIYEHSGEMSTDKNTEIGNS